MDEQKQTEQTAGNLNEGSKPETIGVIERANQAAERMERANAESRELLKKNEEILARQTLGGRADAGTTTHVEPVISPIDYAKGLRDGTIRPKKP